MLQRNTKAIAGEQPDVHLQFLSVKMVPKALRLPDGRSPNRRALPLQTTVGTLTRRFVIGNPCLHLCLALLPYFIRFSFYYVHIFTVYEIRDNQITERDKIVKQATRTIIAYH